MSVFGGFYILDHPVVMCVGDAFLPRLWWCGGHFREESQTTEGEAERKDDEFAYVAAWEYAGESNWNLHKEKLELFSSKTSVI